MRTLDTNVVVRLLIGDDPLQTPIAERAFLDAIAAGGVYVPDVVLAEVAWVLRGYELARSTRHQLLERLVRTRGVVMEDIDAVIDALEHFQQGGDLADHLILARASRAGALPVLSFDQRFSARQGVQLLGSAGPIESPQADNS
ncbi:type II toxin-antitoxin system VapC family toxin [Synechococcus sp. J7-Johnson]|uniref:PIN domain-containing protein n=1 Tax=Synechococcus sp. J7-Johnson TaxID=2823737 RepID=UPI0020CD0A0D|nr:type II toxin-antitoxin system VapC family toxin [Synechococcus sp. J7-Johnson]MCP9841693.1 type II toxin-antitoxin system VapC family toxin [Synechococcus sp. J7-Johnson]